MKKIYFIRHAKAGDGQYDLERDLNERGKKDLALMCDRLKERKIELDAIFSSPAKRCEKTALKMAASIKFDKKIKFKDELYNINFSKILEFVRNVDEKFNEIFIISHNNAITQICEFLSDSAIGNIPTCGIFCIKFDCEFADISEHSGQAVFFEYPKKYKNKEIK